MIIYFKTGVKDYSLSAAAVPVKMHYVSLV